MTSTTRDPHSYILRVNQIALHGFHGVEDAERKHGNSFTVSLELICQGPVPPDDIDLSETVDYARASQIALEIFTHRRYRLIETLAFDIAKAILNGTTTVIQTTVSVKKLRPLMNPGAESSEAVVTLNRSGSCS